MTSFSAIQDMSVNSNWRVINIMVGKSRDTAFFQIHVYRLGPLMNCLQKNGTQLSGHIAIDWDLVLFNLAMNWSYNGTMPRVDDLSDYINGKKGPIMVPCPLAASFNPYVEHTAVDGNLFYQTIVMREEYRSHSVEELRLCFKDPNSIANLNVSVGPSNAVCSSLSSAIPTWLAARANQEQFLLLRLMDFAESHRWEGLFNATIDAYCYGEATLRRFYTPLSHLAFAFPQVKTPKSTLVQLFLVDISIARSSVNYTMSIYQEMIAKNAHFRETWLARLDDKIPHGYGGNQRFICPSIPTATPAPIRPYHIHDMDFAINCDCHGKKLAGLVPAIFPPQDIQIHRNVITCDCHERKLASAMAQKPAALLHRTDFGPVAQSNPGPVAQNNPGPVTQNNVGPVTQKPAALGPVAQNNPGPVTQKPAALGPVAQNNPGPVTQKPAALGPVAQNNPGPVTQKPATLLHQTNFAPVAQINPGPVTQNNVGPVAQKLVDLLTRHNLVPVAQNNPGPVTQNKAGPATQKPAALLHRTDFGPVAQNNASPVAQKPADSAAKKSTDAVTEKKTVSASDAAPSGSQPVPAVSQAVTQDEEL